MNNFVWGSIEHQKEVAKLIGYDFTKWNPKDDEQADLFFQKAMNALFSGRDNTGKLLSFDDLSLLSKLTGRG
jgi:hypothetical protein